MTTRVVLVFACASILALAPRGAPEFGPDAVWHPGDDWIANVHKSCGQFSYPRFGECMVGIASKQAPAPAVAFAHAVRNDGWMRNFRGTGVVDIAYVWFPFRNQDEGWLFVNGPAGLVDPDEIRRLPEREMKADPQYSRLLKAYPKAALFPGDRSSIIDPVAVIHQDGSEEFIVDYTIQDGCHACDVLGCAFFNWTFDAKGRFRGVHFITFEKSANASVVPARPLQVRLGETFTLSLPWNPLDFDWGMEQRPSDAVLHVVDKIRQPAQRGQSWKFAVTGTGTTQMILRYASPKSAGGAQVLPLRITSAPALGA